MPLRVSFSLSERDVEHLRRGLSTAAARAETASDEQISKSALTLVEKVQGADAPDYVIERAGALASLAGMLCDPGWSLPGSVRARVRTALAYFLEPADLIPDATPGLGYLDDAIMIELLSRELRDEIAAYQEFARYRAGHQRSDDQLFARRKKLRARIQTRRNATNDRRRVRLL